MGKSIEIEAPAKVNLFLEVLRRRLDGYHDIESVVQAVSLVDRLTVSLVRGHEVRLECDRADLETDRNLAVLAAKAFSTAIGRELGVRIRLRKTIPVQAGLGGGSSDAAAVLLALNELTDRPLGIDGLREIAAGIGSDVAFFLYGGTAKVTGRGEIVAPLDTKGEFLYLIWFPGFGVSTVQVYKNLSLKLTYKPRSDKVLCDSLREGDLMAAAPCFFNRLEETALALDGRLVEARAQMESCVGSVPVMLSGSGSSLFSVFADADRAYEAYGNCRGKCRGIGSGDVFLAGSVRGASSTGGAKGAGGGDFRSQGKVDGRA